MAKNKKPKYWSATFTEDGALREVLLVAFSKKQALSFVPEGASLRRQKLVRDKAGIITQLNGVFLVMLKPKTKKKKAHETTVNLG